MADGQDIWKSQDTGDNSTTGTHADDVHTAHAEPFNVIFCVFFVVMVGAMLRFIFADILRSSLVPFTVMMMLTGLAMGAVVAESDAGFFVDGIEAYRSMDPHLILYVFLPPLLFESAFDMDLQVLWRVKWQVLLLAVPGVMMSTFLTGFILVPILDWELKHALLLGAIVSATDPVAVVSMLKDLGASKKIAHMIEGESLMNDGTAIVIFNIVLELVEYPDKKFDLGDAVLEFLFTSLGAVVLGMGLGYVASSWLGLVFNDPYVEISILLCAPYLTFFLAEEVKVSGVIAVVMLGIVVNHQKHAISPEVEHFNHKFWSLLGHEANTLIFALLGVELYQPLRDDMSWQVFVVFLVANMTRGVTIHFFYPPMTRCGDGMSHKFPLLMTWGGLRGAVSLALAMVAQPKFADPLVGDQLLLYTSGVVVLTLVVNAPTTPFVMRALRLDLASEERIQVLKTASAYLGYAAETRLTALKSSPLFVGADWEKVRSYMPTRELDQLPRRHRSGIRKDAERAQRRKRGNHTRSRSEAAIDLYNLRVVVLRNMRHSFEVSHSEGRVGSKALERLLHSVDHVIGSHDDSEMQKQLGPCDLWEDLANSYLLDKSSWWWQKLVMYSHMEELNRTTRSPVQHVCRKWLHMELQTRYEMITGYVHACDHAMHVLKDITDNLTYQKDLTAQCREGKMLARHWLQERAISRFPGIISAIETQHYARQGLYMLRREVERMSSEGYLAVEDITWLSLKVERAIVNLVRNPPTAKLPSPKVILREVPWLAYCRSTVVDAFEQACEDMQAKEGDVVYTSADESGLIIITEGAVTVESRTRSTSKGRSIFSAGLCTMLRRQMTGISDDNPTLHEGDKSGRIKVEMLDGDQAGAIKSYMNDELKLDSDASSDDGWDDSLGGTITKSRRGSSVSFTTEAPRRGSIDPARSTVGAADSHPPSSPVPSGSPTPPMLRANLSKAEENAVNAFHKSIAKIEAHVYTTEAKSSHKASHDGSAPAKVFCAGSVLGEMPILTGAQVKGETVRVASETCRYFCVSKANMLRLLDDHRELRQNLTRFTAINVTADTLASYPPYDTQTQAQRVQWLDSRAMVRDIEPTHDPAKREHITCITMLVSGEGALYHTGTLKPLPVVAPMLLSVSLVRDVDAMHFQASKTAVLLEVHDEQILADIWALSAGDGVDTFDDSTGESGRHMAASLFSLSRSDVMDRIGHTVEGRMHRAQTIHKVHLQRHEDTLAAARSESGLLRALFRFSSWHGTGSDLRARSSRRLSHAWRWAKGSGSSEPTWPQQPINHSGVRTVRGDGYVGNAEGRTRPTALSEVNEGIEMEPIDRGTTRAAEPRVIHETQTASF